MESVFNIKTLEQLKADIERFGKDPIEEWMISQGCDPKDGWTILIPSHLEGKFNQRNFIHYHRYLTEPILAKFEPKTNELPKMPWNIN